MAQETVFINFEVDYAELDNAQATLGKLGKVDSTGFSKIQTSINETASDTQGLIKQFKEVGNASIKMGKSVEDAFSSGIQDALDEAGVSVDQFASALKKANTPAGTLKKELAGLKEALARAKTEGKDTGKEFEALRARAGKLADAIQDANAEIKNAGSDTKGIDNVVGSISALAGGYAAVQGAAALFGDESEDLQKTLVKVNSAMALASGLQQVLNALQKEGALIKLKDSVAAGAQTAAMTLYTFVTGGATIATKLLRAALIATGIGAVVVLVTQLVTAMGLFGDETDDAARSTKSLADQIENLNNKFDDELRAIKRNGDLQAEYIKQRGGSELELHNNSIKFTKFEIESINKKNKAIGKSINTQLESIGLFGKGLVENKEQAKDLVDNLNKISTALPDGNKQKQGVEAAVDAIKSLGGQFQVVADKEADIALKTEEYKTKVFVEQAAKRKAFLEKQAEELKRINKQLAAEALRVELAIIQQAVDAQLKAVNVQIENEQNGYERSEDLRLENLQKAKDANAERVENEQYSWNETVRINKETAEYLKKIEEDKRAEMLKTAQQIIDVAGKALGVFEQLNAARSASDQAETDSQKRRVQEQLQAGAITQKAADIRLKQIEQQERRAKQKAAEREKQAAVFRAILAIPQAFLQGLSQGGYVLAAVYAALAAAEAAIIIAKPVPKFFRGKKDSYEGPGVVADMGSELVERQGRMFLYTKPTQTYLGAKDKVYTAAETRKKLHNSNLSTTARQGNTQGFDYDRLAKAIPTSSFSVNIDKDFISESVNDGLMKNNYFNKRYKF